MKLVIQAAMGFDFTNEYSRTLPGHLMSVIRGLKQRSRRWLIVRDVAVYEDI